MDLPVHGYQVTDVLVEGVVLPAPLDPLLDLFVHRLRVDLVGLTILTRTSVTYILLETVVVTIAVQI